MKSKLFNLLLSAAIYATFALSVFGAGLLILSMEVK